MAGENPQTALSLTSGRLFRSEANPLAGLQLRLNYDLVELAPVPLPNGDMFRLVGRQVQETPTVLPAAEPEKSSEPMSKGDKILWVSIGLLAGSVVCGAVALGVEEDNVRLVMIPAAALLGAGGLYGLVVAEGLGALP